MIWSTILLLTIRRLSRLFSYLFVRLPFEYLGVNPATFNILGGEKSLSAYRYPINDQTEKLWLHYWDYDAYLAEVDKPVANESNLVVFLDDYLPFHPDFTYLGIKSHVTVEEYYPVICRFFDYLEETYGLKVVIAAHPKSSYEHHAHNYYDGRLILRGKTIELVHRAKIVVAHSSTAVAFAVLFKKPLIFVTTNQIQHSLLKFSIEGMASILKQRIYNLDQATLIDMGEILQFDEGAYDHYRNAYIKKDSTPNLPMWQIFADYLKSNYK
jgi:hypothetical protein